MDSDQYEYLRVNKYLMYTIGQWPYQSTLEKILIAMVFVPIVTGQLILQGGGALSSLICGDVDSFMEIFSPFIISTMCIVKYINYFYNNEQMKNLLNILQRDWNKYSKSSYEREILCRNYSIAKRITLSYAASLYGSMTPFVSVPILLNVADAAGIYNISGERPLTFPLEHFVNTERYYYPLLIHAVFGTLGFITIVVAVDSMMVVYVQHECSMCEILGYRLEHFTEGDNLDIELHPDTHIDIPYQNARACILLHEHIIDFAKSLEDANTWSYFLQLGFNMIGISFTEYQAVVSAENPKESLRFGCFTICLASVLLLETWPGQQLSDHTERIFEYTSNGKWYQSSIKARKLIHIILMRSLLPIKLTAGKIYVLNLQNYSAVVRTSFSYCTVLFSAQ